MMGGRECCWAMAAYGFHNNGLYVVFLGFEHFKWPNPYIEAWQLSSRYYYYYYY